jgi:phage shock protein C
VTPRRLTRCRHDKQLAGVASGMAEYLGMDPTVVRILWILSVFFGGFTILLYIVLAFVMPLEPAGPVTYAAPGGAGTDGNPAPEGASDAATTADGTAVDASVTSAWAVPGGAVVAEPHEHRQRGEGQLGLAVGVLLVVFGSIALFGAALPGWFSGIALGPAFLLAMGIALVVIAVRRPTTES